MQMGDVMSVIVLRPSHVASTSSCPSAPASPLCSTAQVNEYLRRPLKAQPTELIHLPFLQPKRQGLRIRLGLLCCPCPTERYGPFTNDPIERYRRWRHFVRVRQTFELADERVQLFPCLGAAKVALGRWGVRRGVFACEAAHA